VRLGEVSEPLPPLNFDLSIARCLAQKRFLYSLEFKYILKNSPATYRINFETLSLIFFQQFSNMLTIVCEHGGAPLERSLQKLVKTAGKIAEGGTLMITSNL
jgi:hypothetical protein